MPRYPTLGTHPSVQDDLDLSPSRARVECLSRTSFRRDLSLGCCPEESHPPGCDLETNEDPKELLESGARLAFESGGLIAHIASDLGINSETLGGQPERTPSRRLKVDPSVGGPPAGGRWSGPVDSAAWGEARVGARQLGDTLRLRIMRREETPAAPSSPQKARADRSAAADRVKGALAVPD